MSAGLKSIQGFITNTANYTPLEEIYLPNANLQVGGQPVRASNFCEWNPYFDELDFAVALRNAFINAGLPNTIGMLIDTSRNGWGGAARPARVSSAYDLNTYVDQSRLDRRPHRGGWCNQAGSGIGARPQAVPAGGIHAYVWVKPPGESDGVSSSGVIDPNDPNKKFDAMCDPYAQSRYNSAYRTNALANAPHAGRWFSEQFRMLVENAHPPLSTQGTVPDDPGTDPQPETTFVAKHGRLKVVGTQLTDQHGNPVQLKGMSSHWVAWYPQYINRDAIEWLVRNKGMNVFRVAMGVEPVGHYRALPSSTSAR